MDFGFDAKTSALIEKAKGFLEEKVFPYDHTFDEQLNASDDIWAWDAVPVLQPMRKEAKTLGL